MRRGREKRSVENGHGRLGCAEGEEARKARRQKARKPESQKPQDELRARGCRQSATTYSSSASSLGSSKSLLESSSTLTSLKVSTRTDFTKRSERYTSHTHTSFIVSSK